MIIGKDATVIKRIGKDARIKIEKLTGKNATLNFLFQSKKVGQKQTRS